VHAAESAMPSAVLSPDPSYISSRPIGAAVVTVVSDGALRWAPRYPAPEADWRRALPEADADGRIWLGLNVVLIDLDGARIVIDPALDDPGASFDRWFADDASIEIIRSPGLAAGMGLLGWAPESVTHVVITHPHGDHYGGVARERDGALATRFPNARHFIGRADWIDNPERAESGSEVERRLGPVERSGLLELVAGEREIAPGVAVLPAPGETPGHQVVRLDSGGERLYVLGDLVHHACEVEHRDWAPRWADAAAIAAVRAQLFSELARSGALAVSAHERFPPWRRIVAAGDGFRQEASA
ncbi:MAG TPA: MBL fold metallo-hydrolase, partial [Thermomicrobiales bacterium]|nr:MBL fold metallo-hydrolase [Thermomicrobiales bacterium]